MLTEMYLWKSEKPGYWWPPSPAQLFRSSLLAGWPMKSIVYFKILLADGLPKIMEIMIQTMASKVAFGGLLDDRPRTTDDGELRCPGKMKSIVYFKILLAGWLPKIKEIMIQTMAGKVAFGGFLLMGVFTLSLVAALNN